MPPFHGATPNKISLLSIPQFKASEDHTWEQTYEAPTNPSTYTPPDTSSGQGKTKKSRWDK